MIFSDLPDDIVETIFIHLIRGGFFTTCLNFAQTSKAINERFKEVCQNQCSKYVLIREEYYKRSERSSMFDIAAEFGFLDIMIDLYHDGDITNQTLFLIAKHGHLEIMKWVKVYLGEYASKFAAIKNYINVIEWLHENQPDCFTTDTMDNAVGYKHHELVYWLHKNRRDGCSSAAFGWAALNGDMTMLEFLHKNYPKQCLNSDPIPFAALHGHFSAVLWLYKNGYSNGTLYRALACAEGAGHLEIVKWFNSINCKSYSLDNAAKNGHIHVMKWLFDEIKIEPTDRTMFIAADNGHFEIVKWLNEYLENYISSEYKQKAMEYAAKNGHLNIVKWLYEKQTKPTFNAILLSAKYGHLHVLKWLYENIDPNIVGRIESDMIDVIAQHGHLHVLKWLDENDENAEIEECTSISAEYAAANGHSDVIKWLYEKKIDITPKVFIYAAEYGYMDIIKWLYEKTDKCDIVATMKAAKDNGHMHLHRWLALKSQK